MKTEAMIRAAIMNRVYRLYVLRQISAPMVRAVIFLSAIVVVTPLVSVPNVITNMTQITTGNLGSFLTSAFLETEVFVQGAAFLAAFILLWSLVDLLKGIGRVPAHA